MTFDEALQRLRGPAGTEVRLRIGRPGAEPVEVTLARAVVPTTTLVSQDLGGGVGYVRLTRFEENAAKELQEALGAGKDAATAAVLDLRNNSGGLLTAAAGVAALFLEKGTPIFSTQGRKRRDRSVVEADGPLRALPVVVLVNRASSGATEVVAGALQHRKRAALVGGPTCGCGSVRTRLPLPDRSVLWLTTERLLSATGRAIEGQGLTPDVVVDARPKPAPEVVHFGDVASDVPLQRALEILRARPASR